jgi:hypothetical protein
MGYRNRCATNIDLQQFRLDEPNHTTVPNRVGMLLSAWFYRRHKQANTQLCIYHSSVFSCIVFTGGIVLTSRLFLASSIVLASSVVFDTISYLRLCFDEPNYTTIPNSCIKRLLVPTGFNARLCQHTCQYTSTC